MAVAATDTILDLIEQRRREEVVAAVSRVGEERGLDAAIELLAAVQAEVGERWHAQRWTVADEHAASAIVDHALTVVGETVATAPDARRVVVACAEDEWHVLPARMLAEQLRARGWEPIFLGASSPADQLGRFVEQAAPVAVALSCSLSSHLPGARRSVQACHEAGVPVVVGGSAFPDEQRARAIGADGWGSSADDVLDVLSSWARSGPPALAEPDPDRAPRLDEAARAQVLDQAMAAMVRRITPLADAPEHHRARLRDDLEGLLRAAEAAALVDDRSIVADQLRWLEALNEARGEPAGLTGVALEALAGAVPATLPLGGQLAVEV